MPKSKNPLQSKARNWLITQHDVAAWWTADFQEHHAFRYCVYQIEECPKTGSWHAQIYLQFSKLVSGSAVQRHVGGKSPHIEVAYKPVEARAYCMKEETRVTPPCEMGIWKEDFVKGERTDLTIVNMKIREHGTYRDCLTDDVLDVITSKYPKWVADQLTMVTPTLKVKPKVTVFYGPTGTGKTFRVFKEDPTAVKLTYDGKFIDYSGQKVVLIDEFDKHPWPFGMMLELTDPYPMRVNIKNGYANWDVTHIYLTATIHPNEWFIGQRGYDESKWDQFERRIDRCVHMTKNRTGRVQRKLVVEEDSSETDEVSEEYIPPMAILPNAPARISEEHSEHSNDAYAHGIRNSEYVTRLNPLTPSDDMEVDTPASPTEYNTM